MSLSLNDLFFKTPETETKGFDEENCVICMDKIDDPKMLKCGHRFCTDCIDQQFKFKQQCPTCFSVCGEITGKLDYLSKL